MAILGIALAIAYTSKSCKRGALTSIAVFACVALLLFPVISASDDLHAACVFSDEAAWRHDKRLLATHVVAALISLPPAPTLGTHTSWLELSTSTGGAHTGYGHFDLGRAPPLTS